MNSSAFTKIIATVIGIILGVFAITSSMTDAVSGGIGSALTFVMVLLIPLIFAKPRFGLYVLVILLANIEWLKRLAIYYGVTSINTAVEMLAIPIIVLAILVLSMLAGWMSGANKMTLTQFGLFLLSFVVMLVILAVRGTNTFGMQAAINTGLYISMIPILLILMKDRDDFLRFMNFTVWMFLPWALWGIKQYYTGLSDVEYHYVNTHISPVLSHEVLGAVGKPRPFGLASSQASYGAISFIAWFCLWRTMAMREKRGLYAAFTIIYVIALVLSGQRTALLMPFIAVPAYFMVRSKAGVIAVYSVGVGLLTLGITFAGEILRNLDNVQESISISDGGWAEKTIKVSTFSDRLRGWERLKNPDIWSLFGKKLEATASSSQIFDVSSADYSHDMINNLLMNVGVAGLLPCIYILIHTLYRLHALVLRLPVGSDRRLAAGAISYIIPNLAMSIMGGGNFNTTPVNFFIWTSFAMALMAGKGREESRNTPTESQTPVWAQGGQSATG